MNRGITGSYDASDVLFLLKPVVIEVTPVEQKERFIQSGKRHYSEMIGEESPPDSEYMEFFHDAFQANACRIGQDLDQLAEALLQRHPKGLVLLSLARAGTPPGIVLSRLIRDRGAKCPHYSISIIIGRGVDHNAIDHSRAQHPDLPIVFVDGWTGKGTIARELRRCIGEYNAYSGAKLDPGLIVISDLCGEAALAATDEDYLIPSGILGGIISGLVSRSILNKTVVGPSDFHACTILEHLVPHDISRWFVDTVTSLARKSRESTKPANPCDSFRESGKVAVEKLSQILKMRHGVSDLGLVKLGISEATRALFRRVPRMIIVQSQSSPEIRHLLHLARQRNAPVLEDQEIPYKAVALIREMSP